MNDSSRVASPVSGCASSDENNVANVRSEVSGTLSDEVNDSSRVASPISGCESWDVNNVANVRSAVFGTSSEEVNDSSRVGSPVPGCVSSDVNNVANGRSEVFGTLSDEVIPGSQVSGFLGYDVNDYSPSSTQYSIRLLDEITESACCGTFGGSAHDTVEDLVDIRFSAPLLLGNDFTTSRQLFADEPEVLNEETLEPFPDQLFADEPEVLNEETLEPFPDQLFADEPEVLNEETLEPFPDQLFADEPEVLNEETLEPFPDFLHEVDGLDHEEWADSDEDPDFGGVNEFQVRPLLTSTQLNGAPSFDDAHYYSLFEGTESRPASYPVSRSLETPDEGEVKDQRYFTTVDRLPSYITGASPPNGASVFGNYNVQVPDYVNTTDYFSFDETL